MVDDFREWLSDNLRYIILGLAAILLIVIAFFAIRLITGLGSPKEDKSEVSQETETVTEAGTEGTTDNALVRNQEDILDIVTRYYTAKANKDHETLASLCETFDEAAQTTIDEQDAAIESYNNIITYSKAGLASGEYVVFVYCDVKLSGIDTLAPTLKGMYLVTDTDGSLKVSDMDSHADQENLMKEVQTDADVQALFTDVDQRLEEAMAADADVKDYVEQARNGSSGTTDGTDDTAGEDGTADGDSATAATGTMVATTAVNVRGEPSADATLYGSLMEGMTVEVLENLDSGWSRIRYTTNGTTIEGYVMTQYLGASQ